MEFQFQFHYSQASNFPSLGLSFPQIAWGSAFPSCRSC